MKTINYEVGGKVNTVHIPDNCKYPLIERVCQAPHRANPECDCRWCCFNKEYCKARQSEEC